MTPSPSLGGNVYEATVRRFEGQMILDLPAIVKGRGVSKEEKEDAHKRPMDDPLTTR